MSRIIKEQDLNAIEAIVRDNLKQRVASNQLGSDALSFEAAFLEPIIWQVMIPILVSITSAVIADTLKEKIKKKTQRKDIVDFFVDREVKEDQAITKLCLMELQDLLGPQGFQEHDVIEIYDEIRTQFKP